MNDMNYSISLLTTTGVIATLISILFAIAALVIANRRKKHHLVMQQVAQPGGDQAQPQSRPTAPMTFASAAVSSAPTTPSTLATDNSLYNSTRSTSSPLFKRLGRVGVEQVTPSLSDAASDEQQAAWE